MAAIPRGRQQHSVLKMDHPRYVGALAAVDAPIPFPSIIPFVLLSVFHKTTLGKSSRKNARGWESAAGFFLQGGGL